MKRRFGSKITMACLLVTFLLTFPQTVLCGDCGDKWAGSKRKVDVQAHFHSRVIFDAIERITGERKGFGWTLLTRETDTYMQSFTIKEHLAWMDKFGIEKSIFSGPYVSLWMRNEQEQKEERKQIARFINDYFSQLRQLYPDRAYFMADVALSIGDVEFSTNEARRAIEKLHLNAVYVPTNVGGRQLSDLAFKPFFDEVERLGVPLFTHPESPYGMDKLQAYGLFGRIGFAADENLMVATMIYSGFLQRHPNLKIVLTHLGGTLPYIYTRLDLMPTMWDPTVVTKNPSEYLKNFYFDTANGNPLALRYLIDFLGSTDNILFGTDHPQVDCAEAKTISYINDTKLNEEERTKIYFKNAERLLGISTK
jgi:predicted TIM-barrel fold metal-dependent hydrolase